MLSTIAAKAPANALLPPAFEFFEVEASTRQPPFSPDGGGVLTALLARLVDVVRGRGCWGPDPTFSRKGASSPVIGGSA